MNILEQIAERTKERIQKKKMIFSLAEQRKAAEENSRLAPSFAEALRQSELSFICEVKKASPSKGVIAEEFPYLDIAAEYEQAGAAAISCLTEIASQVGIPVLRKDFTVDEYMIYEAKEMGAAAVLLICGILDDGQLKAYGQLTQELGMAALVEAHSEREVERALRAKAQVIGVNNRDLRTFQVDVGNSIRLRKMVPKEIPFVSESGIRTSQDMRVLYENGTDAVLIGETLMRAPDKKAMLRELRGKIG